MTNDDLQRPPAQAPESSAPPPLPVDAGVLHAVAAGLHHQPHDVLGPHAGEGGVTIRTLRPLADAVVLVTVDGRQPFTHEAEGIWVTTDRKSTRLNSSHVANSY